MTSKQRNKEKAVATILTASMLMTMGSPAFAEELPAVEEQIVTSGIVEVASQPGGAVEEVDVIMSTQQNPDGTIEIKAETAVDGDVTDSGLNVVYNSEKTLDETENVIKEDSEYKAKNAEGTYEAEGGTETNTETVMPTEDDDVEIDVLENGEATNDTVTGGETNSETTPTNEGDKTKAEDAANFDQTTTTTTEREVEVSDIRVEIQTGNAIFVDENGNPIEFEGEDGFHYYYSDIYCVHNVPESEWQHGDSYRCGWSVGGSSWYAVNEDGTARYIDGEGVCQRVVACDNGTPDDPSDDYNINGLYCLDASTGIRNDFDYRKVNLEDAVEEGYYSEEDAEHLRAIMKYGYTWTEPEENLVAIKQMVTDALTEAEESGDTATVELLKKIDVTNLTPQQAATATGMAVWHYGNRFKLEEDEHVEIRNGNQTIDALYQYLITLTAEKTETEIINEEKFIDDMELVVGTMVQGDAANLDNDNTNDKYNVGLKFSLQVIPDEKNDDLIVKVMDSAGNVVQSARIAGDQKEGEQFGYAGKVVENGKTYYVLEGMQLSENSNTKFNLKLEGTQLLTEGVYVFESEHMTPSEAADNYIDYYSDNIDSKVAYYINNIVGKVSTKNDVDEATKQAQFEDLFKKDLAGKTYLDETYTADEFTGDTVAEKVEQLRAKLMEDMSVANRTDEQLRDFFRDKRFGKYDDNDFVNSQNFIGKFKGEAEVDTSMTVDLTFNVEEATVSVTHEWRSESDPSGGGGDSYTPPTNPPTPPTTEPDIPDTLITDEPTPLAETPEIDIEEPGVPLGDAPEEEMFDDPVPLGDAPATGDNTNTMGYVGMMLAALAGLVVTRKRVN